MTDRRRIRRFASYLLRLVAVAALLAAALALAARSDWAEGLAARAVERKLAEATGREARLEDPSLQIFPPGISGRNLTIARADAGAAPPFITVREISAFLSPWDLLRGRIVVDVVEIRGIDVHHEGGEPFAPAKGDGAGGGRRVTLRRLNVSEGAIHYQGHAAPFALDAEKISATASSRPCEDPICIEGSVAAGRLEISWEEHRLAGESASVLFDLAGGTLRISKFHVRGAGLDATGDLAWSVDPREGAAIGASLSAASAAVEALSGPLPIRAASLEAEARVTIRAGSAGADASVEAGASVEAEGSARLLEAVVPGIARASLARGTFRYHDRSLGVHADLQGVMPLLAGLESSAPSAGSLDLTLEPGKGARLAFRTGPAAYRDYLARFAPWLPIADLLVTADGEIAWTPGDPASLDGFVDLSIEPAPRRVGEAAAPRPVAAFDGYARVRIGAERIVLEEGRVAAPGLTVALEGAFDRARSAARAEFRIEEADLPGIAALLREAPGIETIAPLSLGGSAEGTLVLETAPGRSVVSGSLVVPDLGFSFEGGDAVAAARLSGWTDGRRVEIEALRLDGEGWSADGSLGIDARSPRLLERLALRADRLPAGILWTLAGQPRLRGGALSGTSDLSFGPERGPADRGTARFEIEDLSAAGIPVRRFLAHGRLEAGRLRLETLRAEAIGGELTGQGSIDPFTGEASIEFEGRGLDLAALSASLRPGSALAAGRGSLHGTLRIGPEGLSFEAPVSISEAAAGGLPLGVLTGEIAYGAEVPGRLEARVQAPAVGTSGLLAIPPDLSRLEIDLSVERLDLEDLGTLLPAWVTEQVAGSATGRIRGAIPFDRPIEADLTASLGALTLRAGGLDVSLAGPARAEMRGGVARLEEARLRGVGTDLAIAGEYDMRERLAGTGLLKGFFDARLLALAAPDLVAEGRVDLDLRADAEGDRLVYGGTLRAEGMRLTYPGLPTPLEDLELTARLAPDGSLALEGIAFRATGGEVTGRGDGLVRNAALESIELRLKGDNLSVRPIPDMTILFDGTATLRVQGETPHIEARLDVVRALYTRPFLTTSTAAPLPSPTATASARRTRRAASPTLDVTIHAPGDVWVRNDDARLEGAANLHVGGTLARPEVTGRISVFDGGWLRFRDVTYRSEEGGIDFDDPSANDPSLNLVAVTQVQAYEIRLDIVGRMSKPRFELTSQPPLAQRDIVSLLLTGEIYEEGTGGTATTLVAEENVGQYLTAPVAEKLQSTVGRVLGLSSVQLQPTFGDDQTSATARLTLTRRVGPDLLFTYSTLLGQSSEEIYRLEYFLSRAWTLIGLRDSDASVSGSVSWRHRWGGPPEPPAAVGTSDGIWDGAEIAGVRVTGSPIGDTEELEKRTRLKVGRRAERADALEGRENLRAWLARHGYPMASARMQAEVEPRAEGADGPKRLSIGYEVAPGPHVTLAVEGPRRARSLARVVRESWELAISPQELAPAGEKALREHYGSRARPGATIDSEVASSDGRLKIVYRIDPGPTVQVRGIEFQGAASIPGADLRKVLATREDRWNTTGKLRTNLLEQDRSALRGLYLERGYLDVEVGEPIVRLSEDRRSAEVAYPIVEGDAWRVGEVLIRGASAYPAESLRETTLLRPGAPLAASSLETARQRILDLLDANGFNQAKVDSDVEGPAASAVILFDVAEGPREVLDEVRIRGNVETSSRVVAREVELRPGDPISRNAMLRTQANLYAAGIFRSVEVQSLPAADLSAGRRLDVRVEEGDPILTLVGAGYDTEEQGQGFFQIGHANIFGSGRSASLLLRASALSELAQISVRDRHLFGIRFDGLLSGYWKAKEQEAFDERRTGGGLQLRRELTRQTTVLGRYNIEDVNLTNIDLTVAKETDLVTDDTRLASLGGTLVLDTRDDILFPTRGHFSTVDVSTYLTVVGSLDQFLRGYGTHSRFLKIGRETVLGLSARLGLERPFGATDRVPLSERFLTGGDTTLRGFPLDLAGPLDPVTSNPTGGELQVLLNGELRFPIWKAFRGVVFYDMGNSFFTPGDFRWSGIAAVEIEGTGGAVAVQTGIRHVLGAGIHISTPLGPIRLEYGRKLDPYRGEYRFTTDAPGSTRISCSGGGTTTSSELLYCADESLYELFLSIGHAF